MKRLIDNELNKFFFALRNKISFSREIQHTKNKNKENLFKDNPIQNAENQLIKKYELNYFKEYSTISSYKENLYYIKLLEEAFDKVIFLQNKEFISILDIGSKNFSYAKALHHFFSYYQSNEKRTILLDGIEIDPYRIMADFHSRYDYAMYYIKNLNNTRYLTKNLLNHSGKTYDYITWFLPFLSEDPILRWGIPLSYLKPKLMLEHAWTLLKPGGLMLIVNQFESEKNIQLELLKQAEIKYNIIDNQYTNLFSPFKLNRFIIVATKD